MQQEQPGLKVLGGCSRAGSQKDVVWKTLYASRQQRSGDELKT